MPLRGQPAAAPTGLRPAPSRRYVVFTLGGVDYGLPAHQVRHSLPITEAVGPAVVFLRQVYPLVDLRGLFRLPASTAPDRLVLLVEVEGRRAGLVVDRLADLVALDEGGIVALPAVFGGVERRWFAGLAVLGPRMVVIVRGEGVLTGRDGRPAPRPPAATAVAGG